MDKGVWKTLAIFISGGSFFTACILVLHDLGWLKVYPKNGDPAEVLGLLLGAATLIITTVALLMALAAVVGYSYLKESALEAAGNAGRKAARDMLEAAAKAENEARERQSETYTDRTQEIAVALAEGGANGPPKQT